MFTILFYHSPYRLNCFRKLCRFNVSLVNAGCKFFALYVCLFFMLLSIIPFMDFAYTVLTIGGVCVNVTV